MAHAYSRRQAMMTEFLMPTAGDLHKYPKGLGAELLPSTHGVFKGRNFQRVQAVLPLLPQFFPRAHHRAVRLFL